MRWMMLLALGACAVDGEPLDTADPVDASPLECPEGERYELIARLCGGNTLAIEDHDPRWLWTEKGSCSFYEPSAQKMLLDFHPDHVEWWEPDGPPGPNGPEVKLVTTLSWRIDPPDDVLPERLVLQSDEKGKPWSCANDALPTAVFVRAEGF